MNIINKIKINRKSRKLQGMIGSVIMVFSLLTSESCEETFLDVVPDNLATIEDAFTLRNEAEKYLFTCYSYIPIGGDVVYNFGLLLGDEAWIPPNNSSFTAFSHYIARGLQQASNPYLDVWEGTGQGGGYPYPGGPGVPGNYPMFDGIRHCNVLIERLEGTNQVPDLSTNERARWVAEAKFLKAFYHYYLLRMYGPIPVMRTNIPVDAPDDEIQVSREPVDDVVDYLVQLLDEARIDLPRTIVNTQNELGRVTRSAAVGLKAELLLMAASPLFNGNTDMAGFTNKDGTPLFNTSYDASKWQRAADAAKAAIDIAETDEHSLYYKMDDVYELSDTTLTKLNVRGAVTESWNTEVLWSSHSASSVPLQQICVAPFTHSSDASYSPANQNTARRSYAATLESANNFYTINGVPMEEDITLDFTKVDSIRRAGPEHKLNIHEGYTTANLNFNREPRFYADLGFDGAVWYVNECLDNEEQYYLRAKRSGPAGNGDSPFNYNTTGYFVKKLVHNESNGFTIRDYAWPEIRLADVYLMYAEALNEVQGPTAQVIEYVDKVRERAGLDGVVSSWQNFSKNPAKYTTQTGMREIIHRERSIELAFEGKNYWDIRRWKKAALEFNELIQGWNVGSDTESSYYKIVTLYQQRFVSPRDYFWPINQSTLIQNPNLVQNPGW
ncbi:RagB/SusD family nutrient uptake outer membrane protein [Flavobacteriaceae bacterium SZ-1-7]|uniref:RagB/SusD family nutrient uptake outer membrane protein n=1 Tax=Tamlana sedimenti TaxID=3134126 RepID=UPI0031279A89